MQESAGERSRALAFVRNIIVPEVFLGFRILFAEVHEFVRLRNDRTEVRIDPVVDRSALELRYE